MAFSPGSFVTSIFSHPPNPASKNATSVKTPMPGRRLKLFRESENSRMVKSRNLSNDLEPIFFDDRVCQYFLGDFFSTCFCASSCVTPSRSSTKNFPLPHFFYLSKTQASQRVVNRLFPVDRVRCVFGITCRRELSCLKSISIPKLLVHAGCFR